MKTIGGFHPHWVSTLNLGVHVCFLCVMICFVFTAHGYCFSDALIKDPHVMN